MHHGGRSQWWRRPHAWILKRISDQTGVTLERLRRMTLASWASYREDETSERFSERVLTSRVPEWRVFHYAACHECFKSDSTPYVRLLWSVGWVAICPHHGTILTARCEHCRAKLRVSPFRQPACFSPLKCVQCDDELVFAAYQADPRVLSLQQAMLRGKRTASTELDKLGTLTWAEVAGLADALLRGFWKSTTDEERQRLYSQFREDFGFRWLEPPVRYAELTLLAWLTDGWPTSAGAKMGRELLRRWLARQDRTPDNVGHPIDLRQRQTHDAVELRVRERLSQLCRS